MGLVQSPITEACLPGGTRRPAEREKSPSVQVARRPTAMARAGGLFAGHSTAKFTQHLLAYGNLQHRE